MCTVTASYSQLPVFWDSVLKYFFLYDTHLCTVLAIISVEVMCWFSVTRAVEERHLWIPRFIGISSHITLRKGFVFEITLSRSHRFNDTNLGCEAERENVVYVFCWMLLPASVSFPPVLKYSFQRHLAARMIDVTQGFLYEEAWELFYQRDIWPRSIAMNDYVIW